MPSVTSLPIIEDDAQVKKLMEEMESTKNENETLAQKCHELEMKLKLVKEEKSNMSGAIVAKLSTSFGSKSFTLK